MCDVGERDDQISSCEAMLIDAEDEGSRGPGDGDLIYELASGADERMRRHSTFSGYCGETSIPNLREYDRTKVLCGPVPVDARQRFSEDSAPLASEIAHYDRHLDQHLIAKAVLYHTLDPFLDA